MHKNTRQSWTSSSFPAANPITQEATNTTESGATNTGPKDKDVKEFIKEQEKEMSVPKNVEKTSLRERIMKILDPRKDEVKLIRGIWCALAECLCTFIFVFYALASVVSSGFIMTNGLGVGLVVIAMGQGLSLAIANLTAASISGGHLNPAVTISAFIVGRISLIRSLLYIVGQFAGAIAAAAVLKAIVPDQYEGNLGTTVVHPQMSKTGAFFLETIMTFTLVFTIYSTSIDPLGYGRLAPICVGLVVLIDQLIGVPWTGASMNPARSLGPMLVQNTWDHYAIYFFAPVTGACVAALFYELYLLRRAYVPPTQAIIDAAKLEKQKKKMEKHKRKQEFERRSFNYSTKGNFVIDETIRQGGRVIDQHSTVVQPVDKIHPT